MKAIVYKITNDINDKIYIGQSWGTLEKRFARHCSEAKWRNTKKMPIVMAIKKYGSKHFTPSIVEEIEECTQEMLDNREIYWGKIFNTLAPSGYNLKLGQARGVLSEDTKRKISQGNIGKKVSLETIEKLKKSHIGIKLKESTKLKLSLINKGKKLSDEHKEKISKANMGKYVSSNTKDKMRQKKIKFNYKIYSPNNEYIETNNLALFCKLNNLNKGHMNGLASGKKKYYKGWKVERTLIVNE